MKLHVNTLPPGATSPHTIGVLLETILKKNSLLFIVRDFLQLVHPAMGTRAAPPYANGPPSWAVTKKPFGNPLSGQFPSVRDS